METARAPCTDGGKVSTARPDSVRPSNAANPAARPAADPEDATLSERLVEKGLKWCDSEETAERENPRDRWRTDGCGGWGLTATRVRVSFWGDDEVLERGAGVQLL